MELRRTFEVHGLEKGTEYRRHMINKPPPFKGLKIRIP